MIRQFIYTSVISPGGGRAFFDVSMTVGFCRYGMCFMAARRSLFVDWAFFDGSEISSEFVGGQCASWRLPPLAAAFNSDTASFLEKIKRNGGFDFSKLLRKSKNDKQQF